MMTEEQHLSPNFDQRNGTEDDSAQEHDDETTRDTSSEPRGRRSRFFRSKRKQRLAEDSSHDDSLNNDSSPKPNNPPETAEQPTEETPTETISTPETDTNGEQKVKKRSSSPPPPPPSADDTDEPDGSSTVKEKALSSPPEDLDAERHAYLAKKIEHENKALAQTRPSVPTIYTGYQRKKSQSVKLTRIDPLDPCPKKNVRFADDFGLDLSQIKMIKSDELPQVPIAAFKDLNVSDDGSSTSMHGDRMKTITYLEQRFENPMHAHGFEDRVSRHKVVLEQANAIDNRIYGTLKIVTFGFNKRVKIRLTTDNWTTYVDYNATYILDSFDGTHDRFTFTLDVDRNQIRVGNNIQFCISYESFVGPDYWDNNYQQNYRFDCISRTIPDYSS